MTKKCIQKYLQTLLETDGHAVETVSNGFDTISKIESGARPDFIILDILMRVINGFQTLTELLRIEPSLKIIMTSCSSVFSTIEKAFELGACGYLVVGYDKAELHLVMRRGNRNQHVERQAKRLSPRWKVGFWEHRDECTPR